MRQDDDQPRQPYRTARTRRTAASRRRRNHARPLRQYVFEQWLRQVGLRKAAMLLGGALLALYVMCSLPGLLQGSRLSGAEAVSSSDAPQALPTVTPAQPRALNAQSQAAPAGGESGAVPVAPPATPEPLSLEQQLDAYLSGLEQEGTFSGAVLVARGDALLLSKGYGMADHAQHIANTPQTRFRLASLTKPFTALAVLMLHHRGQLNIHDSICTYLETCPEAWQPVTIRHLLSHTSGLPNYTDFFEFELTEMVRTTPDELTARFRDMPLKSEPGALYYYNNSGYLLLGIIIERVSGQSYEDFLRANIFEPLQMDNTGYDHNSQRIQSQALGYASPGIEAPFLDTSTLHASGSLYSTVEDMHRWQRALDTEQFIPADLRAEMFTPIHRGYGYGWKIGTLYQHRATWHPGFINGFSTYMARYPDDQVFIIVLSNMPVSSAQTIGEHLGRLIFAPPTPTAPPTLQP